MNRLVVVVVRLRLPRLQNCVGLGEDKAADYWSYDTARDISAGVLESLRALLQMELMLLKTKIKTVKGITAAAEKRKNVS